MFVTRGMQPIAVVVLLVFGGCGGEGGAAVATGEAPAAGAAVIGATDAPADAVVLTLVSDGSEARYRVRERLVGFELPNDAIGATSAVSGQVALDPNGRVIRDASAILVDLTGLRSDEDRRDGYLRRRTLETADHPAAELTPTELRGLPSPLPTAGSHPFELVGELVIKGVSRETTWRGEAAFGDAEVVGSAATAFTFDDFGLTKPRVPAVLSVADTIRLELDFRLLPGG